jgi:hypothetical protein
LSKEIAKPLDPFSEFLKKQAFFLKSCYNCKF